MTPRCWIRAILNRGSGKCVLLVSLSCCCVAFVFMSSRTRVGEFQLAHPSFAEYYFAPSGRLLSSIGPSPQSSASSAEECSVLTSSGTLGSLASPEDSMSQGVDPVATLNASRRSPTNRDSGGTSANHSLTHPSSSADARMPNKEPVVLFWTSHFGTFDRWFTDVAPLFDVSACPEHRCSVTTDRTCLSQADLIFFTAYTVDQVPFVTPWTRDPRQIWAFFSRESPVNIFFRTESSYRGWDRLFNWTVTYRLDSDVAAVYGRTVPRRSSSRRSSGAPENSSSATAHSKMGWNEWATFEETKQVLRRLRHRKTATALISNCHTSSRREYLIDDLRAAGLQVDVFGRCGSLASGPEVDYPYLSSRYKFFLAFENSVCRDYATEKVFAALRHPWVPVVFGGANYSALVPPGSVVDARRDARGPDARTLARLLTRVGGDEDLYAGYFRWRDEFDVVVPYNWACELCGKLERHVADFRRGGNTGEGRRNKKKKKARNLAENGPVSENRPISKSYPDIYKWWVTDSQCQDSSMTWSDAGNIAKDILHNIF